jgi:hypothetical protein
LARFLFPRWANWMPTIIFFGILGPFATAAVAGIWYYGTDKFFSVGYTPKQPIDYSHKLHAGDMGMDCRYCHTTVDKAAFAAVPSNQVCMNCHAKVRTDSPKLLPLREAWATNKPLPWVQIHNLPDYVYFDHSAHLSAGVGCTSCHGRVDQMIKVGQQEPLTMGWCLECHRNPAPAIRPLNEVTNMEWTPKFAEAHEGLVKNEAGRELNPPTHCSGCHR